MKKTDIAMIILIAGLSIFVSYLIVNSLVSGLQNKPVTVPTAEKISSNVTKPSSTIFNGDAVNPTVSTNIGNGSSN